MIRRKIAEFLYKNFLKPYLDKHGLKIGNTITIYGDRIVFANLTADPTLENGGMWYRSDLSKMRYYDGTSAQNIGGVSLLSGINNLDTFDDLPTADDMATSVAGRSLSEQVEFANDFEAGYVASVFNSANISADTVASILNDAGVSEDRASKILDSTNLSASKASDILKSSNLDADKTQSIMQKLSFSRLIDILTVDASDVTLSADTTYSGVQRFRALDLNGYTYTADGQPHVIIAYSINLPAGSLLNKTATGGAGGTAVNTSGGDGGQGGGGLIILTTSLTNAGTISANGEAGETAPSDNVTGTGGDGGSASFITTYPDDGGDGGHGGTYDIYGAGGGGLNGSGGGSTYSGGSGGTVTKTLKYGDKQFIDTFKYAAVDWWLQNVAGKTPTNTTSFPDIYGAGGGGCGGQYYGVGGGGGGQGGEIVIITGSIDNSSGTIEANGGDGGGGGDGSYDMSGGGGSGGYIYIYYSSGSVGGTVRALGGASPSATNQGSDGGSGFTVTRVF